MSRVDLNLTIPSAVSAWPAMVEVIAQRAATITVDGTVVAEGYEPGGYGAVWTRDHAYTVWHWPESQTSAKRRQFVAYYLSRRTTGAEADPDGGLFPPGFVVDRFSYSGVATYKNPGGISRLPFMDGIAFVVLVAWTDWHATGSNAAFVDNQAAIDECLAALPRSKGSCGLVSTPGAMSVDYGFTDGLQKQGDCTYGGALLAWALQMCADMAPDPATYQEQLAGVVDALRVMQLPSGFYRGSSVNNQEREDVWGTALIVAEGLCPDEDRLQGARALADAYQAGTITQNGWVRHLPVGQYWEGSWTTQDTYQDGGYWLTPLWDCVRAVSLIDLPLATAWATEAMNEVQRQVDAEPTVGANTAPYEWFNGAVLSGPKGYTASAAIVARFA